MNTAVVNKIISYSAKLDLESLTGNKVNSISVKIDDNTMYITKTGVKFDKLNDKDILSVNLNQIDSCPDNSRQEALLHKNIYLKHQDINCIMHTSSINSFTVATAEATIPPVLDDMAQIVGPTARTAKNGDIANIIKALKNRNACLIKDNGMISVGRTLDEAYTACLVLEKAAHTFIWAEAVGGCKPVNRLGAALEHFVYRKKYSKANQDAILKAERE